MPLLIALAQAGAAPPPADEGDVVVIARKLQTWRGVITTNILGTRCVTKRSSGDREIDAIGCDAMRRCWPDTTRAIDAARSRRTPAADRAPLEAEARAGFQRCASVQRRTLIDALVARRTAAQEAAQ